MVFRATSPAQSFTNKSPRKIKKKQISMAIDMKFVPNEQFKYSTLASPAINDGSIVLTDSVGDDERAQMRIIDDLRGGEKSSPNLNSRFL